METESAETEFPQSKMFHCNSLWKTSFMTSGSVAMVTKLTGCVDVHTSGKKDKNVLFYSVLTSAVLVTTAWNVWLSSSLGLR